jgi:hypothetical protein
MANPTTLSTSEHPLAHLQALVAGSQRLLAAAPAEPPISEFVRQQHLKLACGNLLKAYHWHRYFAPATVAHTIAWLAREAGERTSYAGQPYVLWRALYPEVCGVEAIWTALRDGWFAAQELCS